MSHLYNLSVEMSVLSTLMSSDNAYQKIEGQLNADDFYAGRHQVIYQAIADLVKSGQPYDMVMVADKLMADKQEQEIIDYLTGELAMTAATLFNLESYTERLIDLSQRRKISECYDKAKQVIANFEINPADAWSLTAENVNAAMRASNDEHYATVSDLMGDFVETLRHNHSSGVAPNIKTGLIALDNKIMLMKGDMCVIAARPSMGKTTLGQTIAMNIAQNEDGVVVFFSLEMTAASVINRLVSNMATVHMSKIFSGQNLSEQDWENIFVNTQRIQSLPLIIDDRSGITTGQMRATLNRIRQQHGKISAIMVDYLQIVRPVNPNDNKVEQIGNISGALKGLAKEFDCPMIALSQLNRSLENRPDKRPVMSDLRDSGAIEQDADHIVFIYRDEVYNENSDQKGIAELIVGKQRNGSVGTVRARFEGQYNRFVDHIPMYAGGD